MSNCDFVNPQTGQRKRSGFGSKTAIKNFTIYSKIPSKFLL